jgi:hypothetical protein
MFIHKLAALAGVFLCSATHAQTYEAVAGWLQLPAGRETLGPMHGDIAVSRAGRCRQAVGQVPGKLIQFRAAAGGQDQAHHRPGGRAGAGRLGRWREDRGGVRSAQTHGVDQDEPWRVDHQNRRRVHPERALGEQAGVETTWRYRFLGAASSSMGRSVSGGGDLNGDGWPDVLFTAPLDDGLKVSDDTVVEYSYIHDLRQSSGSHNDGIQSTGGTNITSRGNTVLHPDDQTSATLLGEEDEPMTTAPIAPDCIRCGKTHSREHVERYVDLVTRLGRPLAPNGGIVCAQCAWVALDKLNDDDPEPQPRKR